MAIHPPTHTTQKGREAINPFLWLAPLQRKRIHFFLSLFVQVNISAGEFSHVLRMYERSVRQTEAMEELVEEFQAQRGQRAVQVDKTVRPRGERERASDERESKSESEGGGGGE